MTLEQYLDCTVFTEPRSFSRREFTAFMLSQSEPLPETIAIARAFARAGRQRLMTINNQSAELNTYRLRRFGLTDIFDAFFSSCWLGAMKPSPRIFELALSLSQADPARSAFIDDLERNLPPARALGMHTVRFRSAGQLASELGARRSELERRERKTTMRLAMIGLGRMGGNMVRRLLRGSHDLVVYDRDHAGVSELAGIGGDRCAGSG